MMSFCKSVYNFLRFSGESHDRRHFSSPSPTGGLPLLAAGNVHKPANVVESSDVKSSGNEKDSVSPPVFYDDGGEGLRSCTESLGFESCDERGKDEIGVERSTVSSNRSKRRSRVKERDERKFPPPLPSLIRNGRPGSFLKAERKDGRFLLKQVQIDRREIFCASREGGRLRLQFIRPDEETRVQVEEVTRDLKEEEEEKAEAIQETEKPQKFQFPMVGDGFRRCHEMNSHNFNLWNARCVTTT